MLSEDDQLEAAIQASFETAEEEARKRLPGISNLVGQLNKLPKKKMSLTEISMSSVVPHVPNQEHNNSRYVH